MSKQSSPFRFMPKRTLFFLVLSSLIVFSFSFTYFIFENSNQANNTPYYKASGIQDAGLTTITRKEVWSKNNLKDKTELLAKETIRENFIAQTDNLGIIAIPFNAHNRSISDKVVFRLKETGKSVWYFQSTYNADQFQHNIPFPFGFPVIADSKGKSYTFQIESLAGKSGDSLSLSKTNHHFLTKYVFSKSELIKNPPKLVQFLVAKTSEQAPMLTADERVLILLSFLSPIIGYLVFVFLKKTSSIRLIKKVTITYPLDRKNKIKLCSLIICVGFFLSISFHYFQGTYFKQIDPINSFLPSIFFGDFYSAFDQWTVFKFAGAGFGLSYFPGTYLIIDLIVRFFPRTIATVAYLSFFTIFLFFYTYKNVKTNKIFESLQNAFVISLMSYPFLFAFQTANLEIITFISVSLFFIFYSRNRLLSVIFLAYAISMKVFPGIFIVLLLLEKRYRDIFLTCIFTIVFTLLPLLIFDGGFNKGIGNYIAHLKESQKMYFDLMIISDAGNHYGHSILNGLRTFSPDLFPSMKVIILPYEILALIAFAIIIVYLIFFKKTFWKKIACLVLAMNLLPFTSTDYKLLYIFLPLFFLINHSKSNKYDSIFIILLSLLLIPKDYFYFNNTPLSTFNVVANPLIMLAILLLIIFSGIKSSNYFLPMHNEEKE